MILSEKNNGSYYLQIWHADIEVLVHVCMPNDSNVRQVECSEISLNISKLK